MNCNNAGQSPLSVLQDEIVNCTRCPRLVDYRREVAAVKRRAYRDQEYWGGPVPSFGDPSARLLILGLAPGAHGANRTGRMFTGDRSGEFLYRSLHRAGFASQETSTRADDGLVLRDAWITASAHCAPPDNKPLPEELTRCLTFLTREMQLLENVSVVVVLGKIAMDSYITLLRNGRAGLRRFDFRFGHNVLFENLKPALLCSYHPSQQNTSTGKLTQQMLDEVFERAASMIRSGPGRAALRRL